LTSIIIAPGSGSAGEIRMSEMCAMPTSPGLPTLTTGTGLLTFLKVDPRPRIHQSPVSTYSLVLHTIDDRPRLTNYSTVGWHKQRVLDDIRTKRKVPRPVSLPSSRTPKACTYAILQAAAA